MKLKGEEGFIFSGHKSSSYVEEMDNARFCIIPRGNTPWTRRFFDAVVRGCIPAGDAASVHGRAPPSS